MKLKLKIQLSLEIRNYFDLLCDHLFIIAVTLGIQRTIFVDAERGGKQSGINYQMVSVIMMLQSHMRAIALRFTLR